jgi:hypothetical protein
LTFRSAVRRIDGDFGARAAPPVDSVLTGQITRLKIPIETGQPENEKAAPK